MPRRKIKEEGVTPPLERGGDEAADVPESEDEPIRKKVGGTDGLPATTGPIAIVSGVAERAVLWNGMYGKDAVLFEYRMGEQQLQPCQAGSWYLLSGSYGGTMMPITVLTIAAVHAPLQRAIAMETLVDHVWACLFATTNTERDMALHAAEIAFRMARKKRVYTHLERERGTLTRTPSDYAPKRLPLLMELARKKNACTVLTVLTWLQERYDLETTIATANATIEKAMRKRTKP